MLASTSRINPARPLPIRSRWWRALILGSLLFVAFNDNFRAINSRDTAVAEYTALAIGATGTVDLGRYPALVAAGEARGYVQVVDGRARSAYPVLPSLMAAPAYWLALRAGIIDAAAPRMVPLEAIGAVVASLFVACACVVLYLTLGVWRPAASASAVALACGLATPLWSTASQALWSHAPAALFSAIGLGLVLVHAPGKDKAGQAIGRTREAPLAFIAAGASLVLAAACRPLLAVLPFGVGVGLWRTASRGPCRAFVAGLAVGLAAAVVMNAGFYGSWLGGVGRLYTVGVAPGTHGVPDAWSGNWWGGFCGLLLSPNRGILIFTPVALVAVAGARAAWREGGVPRYGLVLGTAAYVVLWAKYAVWWGGQSYGPRFASDIAVPLALLSSYVAGRWRELRAPVRAAIGAALAWSVFVQAVGALSYPAGNWDTMPRDVDQAHERLWDWHDLQIVRVAAAGPYWRDKTKRAGGAAPVVAHEVDAADQ